jgi:hypothetical protein
MVLLIGLSSSGCNQSLRGRYVPGRETSSKTGETDWYVIQGQIVRLLPEKKLLIAPKPYISTENISREWDFFDGCENAFLFGGLAARMSREI